MMGVLAVVGRWTLNGTQRDLINTGFNFISPSHHTPPNPQGLRYVEEKSQANASNVTLQIQNPGGRGFWGFLLSEFCLGDTKLSKLV